MDTKKTEWTDRGCRYQAEMEPHRQGLKDRWTLRRQSCGGWMASYHRNLTMCQLTAERATDAILWEIEAGIRTGLPG
jgi:hypothetical protein